jgi:hypothetical protein
MKRMKAKTIIPIKRRMLTSTASGLGNFNLIKNSYTGYINVANRKARHTGIRMARATMMI